MKTQTHRCKDCGDMLSEEEEKSPIRVCRICMSIETQEFRENLKEVMQL